MREIKFRAWTKDWDGVYRMSFSDKYEEDEIPTSAHQLMSYFFRNLNPDAELMQSTGLHDKNGKEMYEGDICKIHFYHNNSHDIGVLQWGSDASFHIKGKSIYSPKFKSGGNYGDYPAVEVIGNIYENPNLIP